MSTDEDLEFFQRDRLTDKAESIALALERRAAEVRREAADFLLVGEDRRPRTYGVIASRIQHGVIWGFANLGLDALPDLASDADLYRERRISEQPLSPREPPA